MIETKENSLPLRHFNQLLQFNHITHYVSGRRGGVSKGEKSSLNLSFNVGDNPEHVKENRSRISNYLDIDLPSFLFPVQTHSVNVAIVESIDQNLNDTDSLVSNMPGVCLNVMSADCVSLLFYDPVKKVIGAAHAGWRGTVGKIGAKTIEVMVNRFNCLPADIHACIGPSISPEVYQVGAEVISEVEKAFGTKEGLIHSETADGKGYFDLWAANQRQLTESGLKMEHIEVAQLCTYKNSEEFFSARKSNQQGGRFAAGIMLN